MADVNLIRALNEDFTYKQGSTFVWYLDFFQDKKYTIPVDLTGTNFVMDIKLDQSCVCHVAPDLPIAEILTLGEGLSIEDDDDGNLNNRLLIAKVLDLIPGDYLQEITFTDASGRILPVETGTLQVIVKI